jgi:NADH-quinone oxidoreductase subunit E
LRGSDDVVAVCRREISKTQNAVSRDGMLSWTEVECIGACVNAPVMQVGSDFYEDLDAASTAKLIEAFRRGETPKAGSQIGRFSSEPVGGKNTLTDPALYAKARESP